MRLFTSRWANRDLAHLRCVPTGISRGTPRFRTGFGYKLARELAPDDTVWGTADWPDFVEAYRRQLDGLGAEAIVDRLARISEQAGGVAVVMLCFEADPGDCHRGTLSAWLRERGVKIEELVPGDLPEREDAMEMRPF